MAEEAELFGQNVKRLREARDMTQRELAKALPGKTEGKDISRYETGRHMPGQDTRIAIAKALGVSLADLYYDEEEEKGPAPDPFASPSKATDDALLEKLDQILDQQSELLSRLEEVRAEQADQRKLLRPAARKPAARSRK